MTYTVGVLIFVGAVILTVVLHELSHAIVAERTGHHCRKFFIGFGPTLWSHTMKRDTTIGLKLLPLGAFVAIDGLDGGTPDDRDTSGAEPASPKHRAIIAAAGPLSHVLIVFVLIFGLYGLVPYEQATGGIESVAPNGQAHTLGIKPGDRLVAVNGDKTGTWEDVQSDLRQHETVTVTLTHDGHRAQYQLHNPGKNNPIGLTLDTKTHLRGPVEIVENSVKTTGQVALMTGNMYLQAPQLIWERVTGQASGKDAEVGSLVGGAQTAGQMASRSNAAVLLTLLVVVLNMSLAVLNLTPLPPLDGGHVLLAFISWFRQRRATHKGLPAPDEARANRAAVIVSAVVFSILGITGVALIAADIMSPM